MNTRAILALSLLFACDDKGETQPSTDTGADGTGDGGVIDTGTMPDQDGDGFYAAEDCDDADPDIHPGATEVCDQQDNDCDGDIDESVTPTWYLDADMDGYGLDASTSEACDQPPEYSATGGDCDDTNPEIHPGATDIYDGKDNDCNGEIDDLPDWGYTDHDGHIPPEEWADWWPDCGGESQSPIDFTEGTITSGPDVTLPAHATETPLYAHNNGHSIEWTVSEGSSLTWEGETYVLAQFHVHASSEHTLEGDHWPLEIHMVHIADQGTQDKSDDHYVVVGLPVTEGEEDPFLTGIGWDRLPSAEGEVLDEPETTFVPFDLLPAPWLLYPSLVTYEGSLTTPPCTAGVQWLMIGEELELSADQIAAFTAIYDANYRPTQDLNHREVLISEVVEER